jgi:hypothetical protein
MLIKKCKVSEFIFSEFKTKNPVEQIALSNSFSTKAHELKDPSIEEMIKSFVLIFLLALLGRSFPNSS